MKQKSRSRYWIYPDQIARKEIDKNDFTLHQMLIGGINDYIAGRFSKKKGENISVSVLMSLRRQNMLSG